MPPYPDDTKGAQVVALTFGPDGASVTYVSSSNPLPVTTAGTGSASNAAAGTVGAAVPGFADYTGLNVAGSNRGQTGVNPTGSIYAAQMDIASVSGSTITLGQKIDSLSFPVVLPADQLVVLGQTTMASSVPFAMASDQVSAAGSPLATQNLTVQGYGWSTYLSTANGFDNTVRSVKASAGVLGGYYVYNPNAAVAYLQVYNAIASTVTLGTTVPIFLLAIPAASAANLSFGVNGVPAGTAISVASASTPGGAGANSSTLQGTLVYK